MVLECSKFYLESYRPSNKISIITFNLILVKWIVNSGVTKGGVRHGPHVQVAANLEAALRRRKKLFAFLLVPINNSISNSNFKKFYFLKSSKSISFLSFQLFNQIGS